MLCPEVSNFPPPKVISSTKKFENLDKVVKTIQANNFYSSLIITIPDELQIPSSIEECITEDSNYYRITNCSLTEFLEPTFIDKFVRNGKVYCLSADRNCIVQNCAAITREGILVVHLLTYIFQTTGLEGTKRPHNFYEIKIDLKNIVKQEKIKQSLERLEKFDFWISWEPDQENVCPSSIAKYFYERNLKVSVHSMTVKKILPEITEVPSVKDVELDEMTEWIGMLAHKGDLTQPETYISTYCQPDSEFALKTSRINITIVKGFITPTLICNICKYLHNHVKSRDIEHYWVALSVQSDGNSLWQWNPSSPQIFQAHDSSCNLFFSQDSINMFSIGQLKYS